MLPGFRFLFAVTMVCMSLLIFGLGAVILLRATHQELASPFLRPATASALTRLAEVAPPTLAMVRVEPSIAGPERESQPAPAAETAPGAILRPDASESIVAEAPVENPQPLAGPGTGQDESPIEAMAQPPDETNSDMAAAPPVTESETSVQLTVALAAAPATSEPAIPADVEIPATAAALAGKGPESVGAVAMLSEPVMLNPPMPAARPAVTSPKPIARRALKKRRVVTPAKPKKPARLARPAPAAPTAAPFGSLFGI